MLYNLKNKQTQLPRSRQLEQRVNILEKKPNKREPIAIVLH